MTFVEWQYRVQMRIKERKRCRPERNRDGHGHAADQRQARILDEHPRAQLEVEPRVVQPPERSRIPLMLFRLLDAAECAPRRIARVFRAHALRAKLLLEERKV